MNTTKRQSNQQHQNNQRQKTRQQPGARKRRHNPGLLHDVRASRTRVPRAKDDPIDRLTLFAVKNSLPRRRWREFFVFDS